MSKSRSLKIALTKTDLNGKYGDIEFTADLSTVKEAIIGTAGAVGLENCLKLGAVATALYLVVRSIKRKWSWLDIVDVKKEALEVSIPPNKEERFSELMKNNIIEEKLVQDFEKLSVNLEDILEEEEDFVQYRKDILERLNGVRIKSIREPTDSGLPENMVVGKIVLGTRKVKESGKKTAVFDHGNYETKGIAAAEFIGKGGVMEGESSNGSDLVAKGYGADEAVKLAKTIHGNAIKVKIRGEMLSGTFEDKFDPTMTIEEVCETIQKQEKLAKKITLTRKVGELTDEMALAEAERKGSLVTLKAKFFDERN